MEIPSEVIQQLQAMRAEFTAGYHNRGEIGKRTTTTVATIIDNDTKLPWCKAEGVDRLAALKAAIEVAKKTPRPLPAGHDLSTDTVELRKEVAKLRAKLAATQPKTETPKPSKSRKPVLVGADDDDGDGSGEIDSRENLSVDQAKALLKK